MTLFLPLNYMKMMKSRNKHRSATHFYVVELATTVKESRNKVGVDGFTMKIKSFYWFDFEFLLRLERFICNKVRHAFMQSIFLIYLGTKYKTAYYYWNVFKNAHYLLCYLFNTFHTYVVLLLNSNYLGLCVHFRNIYLSELSVIW